MMNIALIRVYYKIVPVTYRGRHMPNFEGGLYRKFL